MVSSITEYSRGGPRLISPARLGLRSAEARRSECPPPRKRADRRGCCMRPDTPVDRPDPATYSQLKLLATGQQPSWNSPDITTNSWGPFRLWPESQLVIRNLSTTAVSRFGLGYPRIPIVSVGTTLPPAAEQTLLIPLPQTVLTGEQRFGFHALLVHPSDADPTNNYGAQIHEGFYTSEAGRSITTTLPVRNPLPVAQSLSVAVLSGGPDLALTLSPLGGSFAAFEERVLAVRIDVAASLHGGGGTEYAREVTVLGQNEDGSLLDGATFVVRVNT
jgi:hypothetical protein